MRIPPLRFPEFRDDGEWVVEKLGSLVNTVPPPQKLPTALYQTEGLFPIIDQSQTYICGWTNNRDALIVEDLPLIIFGDHTCALKIAREPFAQGADGIKILKAKKEVETIFLFQSLHFNPIVMQDYKRHYSILKEKLIAFPKKDSGEQQKIGDCLSSIDALISAQSQKVEALKTHKKGLMQKFFPREGETIPRLRFPEFRDAGEWEGKKLSSIIQLISGLHLSPDQYSKEGVVPYFTGPSDFTNENQSISKWTKKSTSVAKENDTLITVKGSGVGEIWYLTLPLVAMGRQLMAVRSIKGSSRFIYQYLLTKRRRFEDMASGNLIPGLSRGDILDLEGSFPSSIEQQKIADCLSSIDELISANNQKLEALKIYKKGLLHQLFPNMEAGRE